MKLPGSILLVEDSDADCEAMLRALVKCPSPPAVHRCRDGDEAMQFLRQTATEPRQSDPTVILLDLNLPGLDGRDVLEQIKHDELLKHIPVVILTTSSDHTDVTFCYRNGASGYMTKPIDLEQFGKDVRDFVAYWFETVVLPIQRAE